MKLHRQASRWLILAGLLCLALLACKLAGTPPGQAEPAPATTPAAAADTPTPEPTYTPTQLPTATDTPLPTATYTPFPSPTRRPTNTRIPVTPTPRVTILIVVNNLNVPIHLTLSGPTNKNFQVNAHSTFTTEVAPGNYSYELTAIHFRSQTGAIAFKPGTFTWTWGKAKP